MPQSTSTRASGVSNSQQRPVTVRAAPQTFRVMPKSLNFRDGSGRPVLRQPGDDLGEWRLGQIEIEAAPQPLPRGIAERIAEMAEEGRRRHQDQPGESLRPG